MKIILALLLICPSLFAEDSTWELYREIMEREENEQEIEVIPNWLMRETEREVSQEQINNRQGSFDHFIEIYRGAGGVRRLGNDGPNGGDAYGSEFSSIGFEILKEAKESGIKSFNRESFEQALNEVIIYSDEGDYIAVRGQPVDALNFPRDKKILLNRARWRQMVLKNKIRLVFHEYLGIIDGERNVYKVSKEMNKFFDRLVSKLKEGQVQYYYGLCDANLPLSFEGPVCSTDHPHVEAAVLCAKEKALKRCLLESYTECKGQVVIREERLESYGLPTCRVTSIIK